MNILLCGDSGFIGRHCRAALQAAGHTVRGLQGTDMALATRPADWAALLDGVDAVVNAVGVLRDSPRRPMQALHADAPAALFEAAASAGVARLIHLSALGLADNPTRYAQTKRQAEDHLQTLVSTERLHAVWLQPSVVLGPGGASSALFERLAALPWLPLPRVATHTLIQPLAVGDLAELVLRLLAPQIDHRGALPCVGPEAAPLADWIARLRARQGRPAARVMVVPDHLTRLSAQLGDLLPLTPWGRDTLSLLSQPNVADVTLLTGLLGHPPRPALADLEAT